MFYRDLHRDQPNQAYVGKITYIPTFGDWLHLSVFINLCSRSVVGWSMSNRMTATLVTDIAGDSDVEAQAAGWLTGA